MILPWIYCGTLPSIEDENRYSAPPEFSHDHSEYDGDAIDDEPEPEPTTDTP